MMKMVAIGVVDIKMNRPKEVDNGFIVRGDSSSLIENGSETSHRSVQTNTKVH